MSAPVEASDLRCAAQLMRAGASPIGTAGYQEGYLLVEWDLPWPADIAEIPGLEALRKALTGTGLRLQAVVPTEIDRRGLVLHRRPAGPFRGYERREIALEVEPSVDQAGPAPRVSASEAAALGGRMLEAFHALWNESSDQTAQPTPGPHDRSGPVDILICTHGRRDRCCGSFGTELWQAVSEDLAPLRPNLRVWRTSHTGGHRYAATMLILPEGSMWGYLRPEVVRQVVDRLDPPAAVLDHYRGCSGLGSPPLQALERAVVQQRGWSVFDAPRSGYELGDSLYRLVLAATPAGESGSTPLAPGAMAEEVWEARVEISGQIPLPECGSVSTSDKSTPVLKVSELSQR